MIIASIIHFKRPPNTLSNKLSLNKLNIVSRAVKGRFLKEVFQGAAIQIPAMIREKTILMIIEIIKNFI